MSKMVNRQWRLATRPSGLLRESDFTWHEPSVPDLEEGEILVRNVYLSLDPTNRIWTNEAPSYLPPIGSGRSCVAWPLALSSD